MQVLLARLEDDAPRTAGLFDASKLSDLDKENIERAKSSFNRGADVDLSLFDANSASLLFLAFFQELPEPVIGRAVDLSKISAEIDSLARASLLKQLLAQNIPTINYNVLRILMGLLKALHSNEAVTGWNCTKSSDLFGPSVIAGCASFRKSPIRSLTAPRSWHSYGDPATHFIVRSMIINFDEYFPETFVLPEEPSEPSLPVEPVAIASVVHASASVSPAAGGAPAAADSPSAQ